ncbi:MAG: aminotransferase class III-fold pyridoxal phosphate-dependent enzyme [Acidobacteria bacterium]|nr:aminotransferase class III-fold pyridoxal phosphate-dependent enzyme [Acidobacteriota bacterium]
MHADLENKITEILCSEFGILGAEISVLEGYDSENYKVETADSKYVLKLYQSEPNLEQLLTAENLVLETLLAEKHSAYSKPIKNLDGGFLSKIDGKLIRLLSFVEGEFFAKVRHTPELFSSFGKFLAELNLKLIDLRESAIEARRCVWDLQYSHLSHKYLPLIENTKDRKLAEYFFLQYRENVEPIFEDLRRSVLHGDANDWNVMTRDGEVSGIIDFGDMCYSPLVNELAIGITYGIFEKEDPIKWALPIIAGYHGILPLEEKEIEQLYWLIGVRLSVSICRSANAKRKKPNSRYITISERPALELLRRWIQLNPIFVEDEFRKACGFESKITANLENDLKNRKRHTSDALSLQFSTPIKMTRAAFQYMFDSSGNTFLDCYNNIPQVGHTHPRVVKAGQSAMARLNTNTRYLNDVYNKYAGNLLAKFPSKLTKVFFVNSGSAASDLAIRLAMTHTQNRGIVVMEHGYHGNTLLGIGISHYKYDRKGGKGRDESIIEAEIPDTYKGRFTLNDGTAGSEYASNAIDKIKESLLPVSAFIAEPIVGCGGQIPLAKDYLKNIYPFIREQGGVCISDEVQTGFGRLGKYFWGFEMQDVVPDIVILGKPIGNGHPMAAVVTTDEIAASFETGMEFFSSFGGNPVSCAIGQAVLDVLEEEKLPGNAHEVGGYLLGRFRDLVEKYEFCGDARGEGLFLGLEFVEDKLSKRPHTKLAAFVQNKLREKGILAGTDGPFVNVLKVKPPLCFTKENADELAGSIDKILNDHLT